MITFTTVFVILFFIFILYTLWLFIPELAGKGLDFWLVVKFISYFMPTLIPLILPLSILLASIMTFGSFGENYEFAAMKSAGMSLTRISKSLLILMVVFTGLAFVFANDIIPYSKYKAKNFRTNLEEKPSLAIAEGQFNELGIYNIKVDKKSGSKDEQLQGVLIHKKTKTGRNTTVTYAERGELLTDEESGVMKLVLYNGYHFEDIVSNDPKEREKVPFAKGEFDKYVINIDLSGLVDIDLDSENAADKDELMSVGELSYTIDSLKGAFANDVVSYQDNIHYKMSSIIQANYAPEVQQYLKQLKAENKEVKSFTSNNVMDLVPNQNKLQIYNHTINVLNGIKYDLANNKNDLKFKDINLKSYQFSLYEKFAIAYSCLLMFFIGAPLGAIIRKGGFGLPIVFAMVVFIAYHFTTTFGRKIAQDGTLSPFLGAWGSSIILTPIAIILTYRATNDVGMSLDRFFDPMVRFFKKIFRIKDKNATDHVRD